MIKRSLNTLDLPGIGEVTPEQASATQSIPTHLESSSEVDPMRQPMEIEALIEAHR